MASRVRAGSPSAKPSGSAGNVRKGERGTTVVYADRFVPDDERRRAAETGEEAQAIPFLKRFTVFNTDQCEGLPEDVASVAPPPPPGLIEPQAEALIAATGAEFRIGGARAFYSPVGDFVQVPPPQAYFEPINWHRTAFHELSVIGVEQPPDLVGTSADPLARSPTRARNWWRK